jgi:hypothetical protein
MMNKKFNKIFQIGFNKCGTSSMHFLFKECGLKSVHWDNGFIAKKIIENINKNEMPLKDVNQYTCYTDVEYNYQYPFIEHYKLLDQKYPNSLFILNTRKKENWIKSRIRHMNGLYLKNYIILKTEKEKRIISQKEAVGYWEKEWDLHHKEVQEYFNSSPNFLIFDIENESYKLIEFLNKWGINAKKFPHINKTPERLYSVGE